MRALGGCSIKAELHKPSQPHKHSKTDCITPHYYAISEPKTTVVVVEEEIRLPTSGFENAPVFHVRAYVAHIISGCGLTAMRFQSAIATK